MRLYCRGASLQLGASRRALTCLAFAGATAAHAQVSGSVAVVSDYRLRGVSLSERRPAAQLTLSYDHASGAYAGAFASSVRFAGRGGTQTLGHVGYAARLSGGLSWDIGAAYTSYSKRGYAYGEYHVGLAHTDWNTRISHAPRYFGQPISSVYTELSVTPGSENDLVPLFHVGVLRTSAPPYLAGPRSRWDGRVGVAYNCGLLTMQLTWGISSHAGGFPEGSQDKSAWVLRVTRWL